MAQIGIREYDAKRMFFESIGSSYNGLQIQNDTSSLESLDDNKTYVIKPDMLFGKRGKLGLLGINLNKEQLQSWLDQNNNKEITINNVSGKLTHFLIEEFVPHDGEYYISFTAKKDYDEISFSNHGGIDIEENWESVQTIKIPVLQDLQKTDLNIFNITDDLVGNTIMKLRNFYKNYGLVYLEVNPFCFDSFGDIVLLDMVAKIDDQEIFRQKNNWHDLEFPQIFGSTENAAEKQIKKLDGETGASLKMKILNPNGRIRTLLAGGGGSLVMTDTLGHLGYADELGNYGELSGNPDRDFTREYTRLLFGEMLKSKTNNKYLIIAGAIANFTDVAKTFNGIIDVLQEKAEEFRKQGIKILVRRGGINEQKGLYLLRNACERLEIPAEVYGSEEYMTDILTMIN